MTESDPPVTAETKAEIKRWQWQIDRVFLAAIFAIAVIATPVVMWPSAYQAYLLSSDTSEWFHINKFVVYDDPVTHEQRFVINRTIATEDPLAITIMWTVRRAENNEVLCERELFTVWEKTDVIDSVIRNVVRTCDEQATWIGETVKIQGRFSVVLHYGIQKEQTVTSNSFVYTGK